MEHMVAQMDRQIEGAQSENELLRQENAILRAGIKAVRDLIDSSSGIYGLHMNGDLADWSDLERGGTFEEWLIEFNVAEDA